MAPAGALSLDGGTLSPAVSGITVNRTVTLGANGGTVSVAPGNTFTLAGSVGGSGSLTKTDTGTCVLCGVNTYAGSTTISQGTLRLGAAFQYYRFTPTKLRGFSFSAQLSELQFFVNDAWTPATGVTNPGGHSPAFPPPPPTPANANDNDLGTQWVNDNSSALGAPLVFEFGQPTAFGEYNWATATSSSSGDPIRWKIEGSLDGTSWTLLDDRTGADQQVPSQRSTWVASGEGRFSGWPFSTLVGLPDTSAVSVAAGATLDLDGISDAIGPLSGGGQVTLGAGTLTVNSTSDSTFSGVISGSGGLVKTGSGTLTLSGTNIYSGSTTINSGTLQVGSGGTTGSLGAGAITDNGTLLVNRSNACTIGSSITGSGGLTKLGAGSLTLSAANTYAGDTAISAGTLWLGNAGALPGGSGKGNVSIAAGATLELAGFSPTINGLSGSGTVHNGGAAAVLTVGGNDASGTFAGVIQAPLALTKIGSGTQTLTGTDTYAGITTIGGGALDAVDGVGLPTASGLLLSGGVLQSHGTLNRTVAATPGSGQVGWSTGSGGFAAGSSDLSVTLNGGAALVWNASGFVKDDTPLVFGSATADHKVVWHNPLQLTTAASVTREIRVDHGVGTVPEAEIAAAISQGNITSGLLKSGGGTLILSAANSYSSVTGISGGALEAADGTGLPTASGLLLSGGVFQSQGTFTRTVAATPSSSKVTWYSGGGGFAARVNDLSVTLSSGATLTWGMGGFVKSGDPLVFGSPSADRKVVWHNPIQLTTSTAATREVCVAGGVGTVPEAEIAATISEGTAAGALLKTGSGTLVLSSANSYTGGTSIQGGTLLVSNIAGSGTGSGPLTVNSGAALSGTGSAGGTVCIQSGGKHAATAGAPIKAYAMTLQEGAALDSKVTAPGDPAGVALSDGLAWMGQVTKTGTGSYQLAYDGSADNVSVAPAAMLIIQAGAMTVGGTTDPFTQTAGVARSLPVENDGSLLIATGSKAVGRIEGTGSTGIAAGAQLTAGYIQQASVELRGTSGAPAKLIIRPSGSGLLLDGGCSAATTGASAVPEPGTVLLLIAAAVPLAVYACRRRIDTLRVGVRYTYSKVATYSRLSTCKPELRSSQKLTVF